MIKAITIPRACATREQQHKAAALLNALGFARGDGWQNQHSTGQSFLAPLGNLELITGVMPSDADCYIEVTGLEDARRTAAQHAEVSEIRDTDWKSRLFTVEAAPNLKLAFWEWLGPARGKPAALAGDLIATGMKFAIVVARWNAVITDRLLQGAMDCLLRSGARRDDIRVVHVPGSWEIPSAARTLASRDDHPDAILALGCLIRGETAHYEAIYNEVARGLGQSQQETGVPHAFGVLTCETLEQALDRAGLKSGNKGFEAAAAAIEMASLTHKLQSTQLQMAEAK
jgi:6,7-dimethyl-8-ribityllumazine synthase